MTLFTVMVLQSCFVTTKSNKSQTDLAINSTLKGAKMAAFDETYFNGLSAKYAGDFKMAEMYFEQCLKLSSANSSIYFELSQIKAQLGSYETAIEYASIASNAQPDNLWYLENLARIYQKSSAYVEAASSFQKLIDLQPKQIPYYYELASAYLFAGNATMAIKTYERLESQVGFQEKLAVQLVKLYMNEEQFNLAEQKLIEIVTHSPEVKNKAMLAKFYQDRSQLDKAIAIYEQMKVDTPDDPYVKMALYDFYMAQGKSEEAFKNLNLAFESTEVGVNSKLKIVLSLLDKSENDVSLHNQIPSLFETIIANHTEESSAFAFYGEYLSNQKQLSKAQQMLIKAIAIDNSVYQVWNQLLFVESELNQTDSLLAHSLACIELYPNQVIPYYFAGVIYLQQKNYEKGIYYLESAKDLAYGYKELEIQIHSNLGDAYYQQGDFQKAWLAYESALRQDPSNDYVLNNYAYFLCLENTDLVKALEMSKRTVDNNPNSAVYLDTYGWILYTNKQYDQAVIYLQKAVDNDSEGSGEILEHLGDAYYKLGNTTKAIELWNLAKKAGGGSQFLEQKIRNKRM